MSDLATLPHAERLRDALQPRRPPSMLQWAEEHVVIPDGPHRGERFDASTQPYARLFLGAVDSGRWERIVAVGPTQTGKSLVAYIIPTLYHLFALGETVVAGLPTIDMADDKWTADFLPVIEASPSLRKLLPGIGPGARSGKVRTRVKFRNGATLRFMSAGGHDKTRAGFTARVLAVTEVDGFGAAGGTSDEPDKLKQLEARQRAYLKTGTRTYLECTVTTSTGRIWAEYIGGTQSRIARPCPHCGDYVTPERENLTGWQDAADELAARAAATWTCPACASPWTESERYAANLRGVLVHRGQEVTPEGEVTGPAPATRTLGFRWTAADNHFATAADVGADEWRASRERDRENAEKQMSQFVHAVPYDPPDVRITPLDAANVMTRTAGGLKKGVAPADCAGVTVGIDTGKRLLHWVAIGWTPSGGGNVIEYGTQTVLSDKLGTRAGLVAALRDLQGYFTRGWQAADGGAKYAPDQVWIDSGYHEHQDAVYEFCSEANHGLALGTERYRPSKGYGEGQRNIGRYWAPRKRDNTVRYIGQQYHLTYEPRAQLLLVHINTDHWKSELHQRMMLPADAAGAIVLFETADQAEHRDFADQLTAERQIEKYVDGRGDIVTWQRVRRANHYLDASYAAVAAGHLWQALRVDEQQRQAEPKEQPVATYQSNPYDEWRKGRLW